MKVRNFVLISTVLACFSPVQAQVELPEAALPNSFSVDTAVPAGCLFATPDALEVPQEGLFVDENVGFNIVGPGTPYPASLRVRVWRVGCHEDGRSAILVNFALPDPDANETLFVPRVYFEVPDAPDGSMVGPLTLQGPSPFSNFGSTSDVTLVANVLVDDLDAAEYNGELLLSLTNPDLINPTEWSIPAYDPARDLPQFEQPPLHGRYSGQWTLEGFPRQGLVLQVGETGQRNFAFVTMFTYLDGAPVWVVGNADFEPGANEVTMGMLLLDGGEFFTGPPDAYTDEDVDIETVGTMTLRANSCNSISADVDFSESGLGTASLDFERLIRIAGYDCDQTR